VCLCASTSTDTSIVLVLLLLLFLLLLLLSPVWVPCEIGARRVHLHRGGREVECLFECGPPASEGGVR